MKHICIISNGAEIHNEKHKISNGIYKCIDNLKWVHVGPEGTKPGPASAHPADF